MEKEKYKAGDDIIVEGTLNDKIRFILEGRVTVTKEGLFLCEFKEGDAFGEMEVLEIMPSAASIKAQCEVLVMSISNKALREIYKLDMKTFAMIIMNLARDLSRRLRRMNERAIGII
jgi:CRP-like cAMP-binding protein